MSDQETNTTTAHRHIEWTHDWQEREGDTPETGLANAILANAYAQLAVADAINSNGATERMQQQLKHNAEAVRIELERGFNPKPTDQDVEELAADLWKADPANEGNPAREFAHDYAHRQDSYLKMARAALGISEEPRRKDSRRP